MKKDIILRSYPNSIPAYEWLYKIECKNLPIIYDVINLEDGQIILEEYIDGITVGEVIESGKYNPSILLIQRIANGLGKKRVSAKMNNL